MARPAKNLEGLTFGKLTVTSRNFAAGDGKHAYWNCTCSCRKSEPIVVSLSRKPSNRPYLKGEMRCLTGAGMKSSST